MDTFVLMKVCKLKSGLNDIQGIGDYGTDNTSSGGMQEIMSGMLLLFFEVLKCAKKGVAAETCFQYGSNHAFVKSLVAILVVDEQVSLLNVGDKVISEL